VLHWTYPQNDKANETRNPLAINNAQHAIRVRACRSVLTHPTPVAPHVTGVCLGACQSKLKAKLEQVDQKRSEVINPDERIETCLFLHNEQGAYVINVPRVNILVRAVVALGTWTSRALTVRPLSRRARTLNLSKAAPGQAH